MTAHENTEPAPADRLRQASLKNWGEPPAAENGHAMPRHAVVDCGWGRLIFGQTFDSAQEVAQALEHESEGQRDVAFYVREPHVVLACAPQSLFLDPSHAFRLDLAALAPDWAPPEGVTVRPPRPGEEAAVNRLYLTWLMVPVGDDCFATGCHDPSVGYLVVTEDERPDEILGVVMGIDHRRAIDDPDNGSSLWALAVDPQARRPGLGETLVMALAHRFRAAGRAFMDLSVMHDNAEAIALYTKLGFARIPVYCVKRKNPINEKLFIGPPEDTHLNVYAQVIVDEAKRRGIGVEVMDAEAGLFRLNHGGRVISCRESLSDLTTAVALSRCDDKALTHRLLDRAGLRVPAQATLGPGDDPGPFCARFDGVVVKPARGEQGQGVAVDLRDAGEVDRAVARARGLCDTVIVEECVPGQDLRVIVIDDRVVAAALRRPPAVRGDGVHTVAELIAKLSRRRQAATGGESHIPMDDETERCIAAAGHAPGDILPEGETLTVRKTANLHTGGTIHDVTDALHPSLATAAVAAARALEIPVVGLDLMVADPARPDYAIIEANERPGLANHEPQPTTERFIDLLFPHTAAEPRARNGSL